MQVHAFHLDLPLGATELIIEFQALSPTAPDQGRVGVTLQHINLQWNSVVLYPAGYESKDIVVDAELMLPKEWEFACALEVDHGFLTHTFRRTDLATLVDSPLFAGKYVKRYPIDKDGAVTLNVFGDKVEQVNVGSKALNEIGNLIIEADALFGARPFRRYDFLIATSDELGALGVEHHRSAEIVLPPEFFSDWGGTVTKNDILAHEYVHAWNGKYRRGRDSRVSSFDQPIQNSLLWVYEGLTQYYGQVLAVRSGLWDKELFDGALARTAAQCELMAGRAWRPLRDTTADPIIASREHLPWISWQRTEDYYSDGQLIWLEVDTKLREASGGAVSLDDFMRVFFGKPSDVDTLPYDFEELVDNLASFVTYEWAEFFKHHLSVIGGPPPLRGIERAGYRVEFRDKPSRYQRLSDSLGDLIDARFSIGVSTKADGTVQEVIWGSAAFQAGLTAGSKMLAVNDRCFSAAELENSIAECSRTAGLTVSVEKQKHRETLRIAYEGALRYPILVRRDEIHDRLDDILRPKRK